MLTGYFIHFFTIFTGIAFMWVILDVDMRTSSLPRKLGGFLIFLAIFAAAAYMVTFSDELTYRKLYPLLVHAPLLFAFWLLCERQFKKVVFSFVTALTMMATPIMVMRIVSEIFPVGQGVKMLVVIVCNVALLYALRRWAAPSIHFVFTYQDKTWWLFLCIPLVYWASSYLHGQYAPTDSHGTACLIQSYATWVIVQLSFLLIFSLFNKLRCLHLQEEETRWLAVQMSSANSTIEQMKAANEQSAIYRHDLRHHINVLDGYLQAGNTANAAEYLHTMKSGLSDISPANTYCTHSAANLLLASYAARAQKSNVSFCVKADIPAQTAVAEKDLCVLIGNGLDNAFSAAEAATESTARCVSFTAGQQNGQLGIQITNGCNLPVVFENGLPVSHKKGHGFGTKSIQKLVQAYNGICAFSLENELFVLRMMV